MLEDAALVLGGSAAGRGPAERGHCTPDGPARPEEESCPSPAGSQGKLDCRWSVCVSERERGERGMYVCVCEGVLKE